MSNKGVELQKTLNTKRILHIVRKNEHVSKNRIKELTGLSFATVSAICNELVSKNILEEDNLDLGTRGRAPKRLSVKKGSFFAICLDLQNLGSVDISIQDIGNNIIFSTRIHYETPFEIDETISRAHEIITRESDLRGIDDSRFIGVGVSISGIFDLCTETVEECAIPQWNGLNLKQRFETVFEMPVYIDNEANLCACQLLSYPYDGGCKQNIVYMHMGEGIGVGIIVDGKLLRGATGYSAEISHLPIGNPETHCSQCGNSGCAEMELSKAGFVQKYGALEGMSTREASWKTFVEAVHNRDPWALQVMRENGELIAKCVIILMMLFDPNEFYVGGSIVDVYEYIAILVENRIGRLGRHYARIPIHLDAGKEQAVMNGIMEMLIWRWEL